MLTSMRSYFVFVYADLRCFSCHYCGFWLVGMDCCQVFCDGFEFKTSDRYSSSSSITEGILHVPRDGPDVFPPNNQRNPVKIWQNLDNKDHRSRVK